MIHRTEITIRTFHTDAFGHVNNSRYLELLEEARWRFAEDVGLTELIRSKNLGFIIVDLRLRFRKPVAEGDVVVIETFLESLGTASGDVIQNVHLASSAGNKKNSPAVKGSFHFILIDRDTGRSVPIEGVIRQCLNGIIESKSGHRI